MTEQPSTAGDLHEALHRSRAEAIRRGHSWDVADVIAVIDTHGAPATTTAVLSTAATLRLAVSDVRRYLDVLLTWDLPPDVMGQLRAMHRLVMVPTAEANLYRPDHGDDSAQMMHTGRNGRRPGARPQRDL